MNIYTLTFNNIVFTKHQRLGVMAWGYLREMTQEDVVNSIASLINVSLSSEDIEVIANWACINPPSATYDYPEEDRTRALLGALQEGYVTVKH